MKMDEQTACLYYHARIFTADPDKPHADAMVVRNGRIEWIGNESELGEFAGERIDLKERRVLPGFVDAHLHPLMLAQITQQIACMPPGVAGIADAPSIRIEHAALPTKQAIRRAGEAGIAFVTQPIFLYAEIESYLHNLGAERTRGSYPLQDILQAGVPVALSSDAPATAWADPVNPLVGLKAAVTRLAYDGTDTGQEQRVDVATAITLYTQAAQHITRIPQIGKLAPGYHADFIVLDTDILAVEPQLLDAASVEQTYMGGRLVYQQAR